MRVLRERCSGYFWRAYCTDRFAGAGLLLNSLRTSCLDGRRGAHTVFCLPRTALSRVSCPGLTGRPFAWLAITGARGVAGPYVGPISVVVAWRSRPLHLKSSFFSAAGSAFFSDLVCSALLCCAHIGLSATLWQFAYFAERLGHGYSLESKTCSPCWVFRRLLLAQCSVQ